MFFLCSFVVVFVYFSYFVWVYFFYYIVFFSLHAQLCWYRLGDATRWKIAQLVTDYLLFTHNTFTLQAKSELQTLRRHSQELLETAPTNEQLNEALGQIEELKHELGKEKEKRASKEEELRAELQQLQESSLLEENKSEWWASDRLWPSNSLWPSDRLWPSERL